MAVTTRRSIGGKTNIYWTKDTDDKDDIVKVHFPGVNLEPTFDIKEPKVKKPTKPRKPDTLMLQKRSKLDAMKQMKKGLKSNKENINSNGKHDDGDEVPVRDTEKQGKESPKKIGLKDLKPEDKKRVSNLVKELAKVGEERELALSQLTEERVAFEERLQILQEEYESNINEKLNLQNRFLELQELLKKYKESDKGQSTPNCSGRNKSSHTTQTSPLSPININHKSPLQELSGNERKVSPRQKVIDTSDTKHSSHSLPERKSIFNQERKLNTSEGKVSRHTESGTEGKESTISRQSSFPGNKRIPSPLQKHPTKDPRHSRQSTPLPENSELQVVPGIKPVDIPQESKPSETTSTLPGTSSSTLNHARLLHGQSIPRQEPIDGAQVSQQSPVVRKVAHQRHNPVLGNEHSVALHGQALFHPPSTHDQASTHQPIHNQASFQNPSTHNQVLSNHAPAKFTDDSEPPVYANKLFDIAVTRSGVGRPLMPPSFIVDNTNRSQSETSQSFSAELDAVYRLYCREYELQLQLQQQQLELQKQQLQLQQQLQQLELFQQRQQTQQQAAGPVSQQQPSTPAKPIIRATPIPTPAPQPSIQPRLETPPDGLEPTPNDSVQHRQGSDGNATGEIDRHDDVPTMRRITSSKRPPKRPSRPSYNEGSFTSHQPIPIPLGSTTNENLDSFQHKLSSHQLSHWAQGSVTKEIINPKEAARFKFSLYRDKSNSPTKHSAIDWSNASDLDFRRMQESRIREHYGLQQYPLHSTQASLPLQESFPTRASYALYERPRVAEEPSKMNGGETTGVKMNSRESNSRDCGIGFNMRDENIEQHFSIHYSDQQLPPHQQYSSYSTRNRTNLYDNDYLDSDSSGAPWVSHQQHIHPSNTLQQVGHHGKSIKQNDIHHSYLLHPDLHHETSLPQDIYHTTSLQHNTDVQQQPIHVLNYPLQIVDLVNEMEDEPTITSPSRKPSYAVYPSSPFAEPSMIAGILDSTDSGYSNVSRDVYEHKSPVRVELDGDDENEERDVLEDIFFI